MNWQLTFLFSFEQWNLDKQIDFRPCIPIVRINTQPRTKVIAFYIDYAQAYYYIESEFRLLH